MGGKCLRRSVTSALYGIGVRQSFEGARMPNELVRDLVHQITAQLPMGSELTLRSVTAAPRVQRRVDGAAASEGLINRARQLRLEDGTPFWHVLFNLGEDQEDGVPIEIAQSALFHQDPENDPAFLVRVDTNVADRVADVAESLGGLKFLSIDSGVTLADGSRRFIPMLDFSVKSSKPGGFATAVASVEAIGEPGLLASSGRSYHFYGKRLLTSAEQVQFWARALLLTPIVDERWIAHQMLGGRAALRVSPNERGDVPHIVWELGNARL